MIKSKIRKNREQPHRIKLDQMRESMTGSEKHQRSQSKAWFTELAYITFTKRKHLHTNQTTVLGYYTCQIQLGCTNSTSYVYMRIKAQFATFTFLLKRVLGTLWHNEIRDVSAEFMSLVYSHWQGKESICKLIHQTKHGLKSVQKTFGFHTNKHF